MRHRIVAVFECRRNRQLPQTAARRERGTVERAPRAIGSPSGTTRPPAGGYQTPIIPVGATDRRSASRTASEPLGDHLVDDALLVDPVQPQPIRAVHLQCPGGESDLHL